MSRKSLIERRLCYLLRHGIVSIDDMDCGGWVHIDRIIELLDRKYPLTRERILDIVANDSKGRYEVDGDRIRAKYGHGDMLQRILKNPVAPPLELYHGTSASNIGSIMINGLSPMSRQMVHLTSGIKAAIDYAKRFDNGIVVSIAAKIAYLEGVVFYNEDAVWMCEKVPHHYIFKAVGVDYYDEA